MLLVAAVNFGESDVRYAPPDSCGGLVNLARCLS